MSAVQKSGREKKSVRRLTSGIRPRRYQSSLGIFPKQPRSFGSVTASSIDTIAHCEVMKTRRQSWHVIEALVLELFVV